ncbi:hypothetical protein M407DRAFT_17331 [Tulasnella calospora MUT 4182]|uniref:Uncharacterized protein n=1 Tax=Tulasnella calospora MUT 4182 TaxID=1051891 RepID=A0A0C3QLP5_9AGAM|nr:hypothetical protein M407DRAFT_17331 [Tulasnella calospora MUT 4182]
MSRNSLETQGDLVFYGNDGIEAEEFVRAVIRTAKAAGRFRDNDWIIEEVAAGFSGDALRWYIELDDETQNDWKLLRRAILQKYPPPSQRSQSDMINTPLVISDALSIVPTSAAAAPPPVSGSLSREAQNLFHIKILFQSGGNSRYLGVENGDVVVTYTPLQAVTVRLCERTKELRLISEGNETGEKLAVRYSESSKIIFSFCWIRYARLEVVDGEGSSRARDPVSSGISIASWDVNNHNFLQATPQGDYPSSVDLYLDTSEARQQYQPIRAYLDRPIPLDSATEAQFLNLELEEV